MSDDIIIKMLGEKIRVLRKEQKLSQEELAEKCSLHRTYIGFLERGEKNMTVLTLYKISKALNIEMKELVSFE